MNGNFFEWLFKILFVSLVIYAFATKSVEKTRKKEKEEIEKTKRCIKAIEELKNRRIKMKFYKMIEITKKEYVEATGDTRYDLREQTVMHEEDASYIAVTEELTTPIIELRFL